MVNCDVPFPESKGIVLLIDRLFVKLSHFFVWGVDQAKDDDRIGEPYAPTGQETDVYEFDVAGYGGTCEVQRHSQEAEETNE